MIYLILGVVLLGQFTQLNWTIATIILGCLLVSTVGTKTP